jgi:hypothetical protein
MVACHISKTIHASGVIVLSANLSLTLYLLLPTAGKGHEMIALVEFGLMIVIGTILFTQIIIPGIMNTKMFPMFRRRGVEKKITSLREKFELADLERQAKSAEADLKAYRDRYLGGTEEKVDETPSGKES